MTTPETLNWSEFSEKAREIEKDIKEAPEENTVVNVIQLQPTSPTVKFPKLPKRLDDFSGFSFFTLAPVYTYCNVPYDILEAFKQQTQESENTELFDPERFALKFNRKVLDFGDTSWDYTLEGIPTELMGYLSRLCGSQRMRIHRADGSVEYCGIYFMDVFTTDPIAVCRNDVTGPLDKAMIRVFLPTTNLKRFIVNPVKLFPIKLISANPEQQLVIESKAVTL